MALMYTSAKLTRTHVHECQTKTSGKLTQYARAARSRPTDTRKCSHVPCVFRMFAGRVCDQRHDTHQTHKLYASNALCASKALNAFSSEQLYKLCISAAVSECARAARPHGSHSVFLSLGALCKCLKHAHECKGYGIQVRDAAFI